MNRLNALLEAVGTREIPAEWLEGRARVAESYDALMAFVAAHPDVQIYGVNTLSGHRDDHRLDDAAAEAFQAELIASHAISDAPDYPPMTALTITATKLQQLSQGGATLSEPLYSALLETFADTGFVPSIPMQSSYSCGDVIPAAHWAQSALRHCDGAGRAQPLRRGDGMALINGSFVHLGYAASLAPDLAALWAMQLDAMRSDLALGRADASMLDLARDLPDAALEHVRGSAEARAGGTQWPVSFRAMPETLDLLHRAYVEYLSEIDAQLGRPSGNPLMQDGRPYSQASFFLPLLTTRTSAILEALMFSTSAELGRIKWLVSGSVEGIPLDGQSRPDDVAFIQWPKLMQAMVEELRLLAGRAIYASGGDTSFGVEDLWSNGVVNLDRLVAAMSLARRILALGLRLKARVGDRFGHDCGLTPELTRICLDAAPAAEVAAAISAYYRGPAMAGLRATLL